MASTVVRVWSEEEQRENPDGWRRQADEWRSAQEYLIGKVRRRC